MVGIPPSPRITTKKNIYLCRYDKNDEDYYDGYVSPFLDSISDEKEFDDDRGNRVSKRREGHVEVRYQSGKLVLILMIILMQ